MSNARNRDHKDKKRKASDKIVEASFNSSARLVTESDVVIEMKKDEISSRISNVFKNHNKPLKNSND